MYFGLINTLATFQALINIIFANFITEKKVVVYLNDILIWFSNLKFHYKIVHEVLECLKEYDLYFRPKKCKFEKDQIKYLGLLISERFVSMDSKKVKAVTKWLTYTNFKDVRGFVGFANFY